MENKLILLFLVVILFINLTNATVSVQICPKGSAKDYILGFQDRNFQDESVLRRPRFVSVTEVILEPMICCFSLAFLI